MNAPPRAGSPRRTMAAAGVMLLALAGCDPNFFGPSPVDAGASPNASVVARPVVNPVIETPDAGADAAAPSPRDGGATDAGPAAPKPPQPLRADEVLPQEATRRREIAGVSLDGRWLWSDLPRPADTPETNRAQLDTLAAALSRSWQIELTGAGRMRIDFTSRGMPLTEGSALVARRSRYGHLLLWPDARAYRVLPPGTLRTVLGELRADITPLSTSTPQPQPGGERLELSTKITRLRSAYGEVVLEQAAIAEAGEGGALLCRTLIELAGVAPASEACTPGWVALAASYRWGTSTEGPAALRFEVTAVRRQLSQGNQRFAMAPRRARRQLSGLPALRVQLSGDELRGLRNAERAAPEPPQPDAPSRGLEAFNGSDQLLWLFLDGLPAVAVSPYQTRALPQLQSGRYALQWRSYLGDIAGDAGELDTPARSTFGEAAKPGETPDAGP